jgi:putative zinc finger/helix-turn-helix YgiT family protein
MKTCLECGSPLRRETRNVPYRSLPGTVLVGVDVDVCDHCGESYEAIPSPRRLEMALARMLAQRPGRLTGAEIRFLRKVPGWSGADFARHFGVTPETVSRWENDKVPMSDTADRLLRVMATRLEPIDDYAALDKLLLRDAESTSAAEASAPRLTHNDGEWIAA